MRQLPPPRVPPRKRPHIHSTPLCAKQGAFTTLTIMHFATALGLPAEAYLAAAAFFAAASFSVATHVSTHVIAAIACAIATTILAAPVTTIAINTVSITVAGGGTGGRGDGSGVGGAVEGSQVQGQVQPCCDGAAGLAMALLCFTGEGSSGQILRTSGLRTMRLS